jgi:DNA polymerase III subunit alpha
VNLSGEFFTIDKVNGPRPSLRFGLAAVKNVGEGAVRPIVEERKKNGPYLSIDDFCRRAAVSSLNRRTLESLVKAGAFDSLGPRGAVLAAIDQIIATAQLETRMRNSGQTSMFGALEPESGGRGAPGIPLNGLDASVEEKATWERELLGVSLSYNPLFALASIDAGDAISSLDELDEELQGQTLALVGHVSALNERYTREQKKFFIVTLDLLGGPVETLVWPDVLERTQQVWQEGKLVKVTGKLRVRGDQFSLACDQVEEFDATAAPKAEAPAPPPSAKRTERAAAIASVPTAPAPAASGSSKASSAAAVAPRINGSRAVVLTIHESDDAMEDAHLLREVVQVLLEYPGKDRVNLQIRTAGKRVLMELPVVSTGYCQEMKERLERVLGEETVLLQGGGPGLDAAPF